MSLIIFLLVLSVLIFIHELGHFLVARFFGVKVYVFSIGFGKTIFEKEFFGTLWRISLIPLGGYVRMKGQDDTKPNLVESGDDSYNNLTPIKRILILFAGPFFNFLLAFFIYIFVANIGVKEISNKIGQVVKNSPAFYAGLKENDEIIKINNQDIKIWSDLKEIISNSNGSLVFTIKRDNKILNIKITPKLRETKNMFQETIKRKMVGIAPKDIITIKYNFIDSISYAYNKTIEGATLIFKGVEKLITGVVSSNQIGGVISIGKAINDASEYGFVSLLLMSALISINLGVLNLLPIPALDGGHIMFNLYELITRKKPSEKIFYYLTISGWFLLIFLMLLGFYNDINRFFLKD